jgi:hypothetical protein
MRTRCNTAKGIGSIRTTIEVPIINYDLCVRKAMTYDTICRWASFWA